MAAVNALMPGCAAGLYLNSATGNSAFNTPTWGEVTLVKDVDPTAAWDFAEARSRATPLKLFAKTGVDLTTKIVMRADPEDADFQAFVGFAETRAGVNAVVDLLILDAKNTVPGAVGQRGPFLLSISEEPQEIDGMIYYTFDAKPTMDTYGNVPEWAFVAGNGTLTYTTIAY